MRARRNRSFLAGVAGTFLLTAGVLTQGQSSTPAAEFDVASVRRGTEGRPSLIVSPSGVSFTNVTLADALAAAFDLARYQVRGPDWLTRERYVIIGKSAVATDLPGIRPMLQTLLTARFGLQLHREQRNVPMYVLRVGKHGPSGLTPATERLGVMPATGGMTFQGMTMQEFVDEFLSRLPSIDRAVIDATGLSGRFTFSLRVFENDPLPGELKPAVLAGGPELFIHALENIGLVLARETRPVSVLVVESASRTPVEN